MEYILDATPGVQGKGRAAVIAGVGNARVFSPLSLRDHQKVIATYYVQNNILGDKKQSWRQIKYRAHGNDLGAEW